MLPWDKLAQFVVVASFEWLDWLPSFDGALIRNFIYPASVNDRFFSLLSFMHIGMPLVVLLLMWIHVQRVPKAKHQSAATDHGQPAAHAAGAVAGRPGAQPGRRGRPRAVPWPHVQLDWFYLLVFPLLYLWPLGQVWALLVGATALLVLLPWLPPKLRRGAARELPDARAARATASAPCAAARPCSKPACARAWRCPSNAATAAAANATAASCTARSITARTSAAR